MQDYKLDKFEYFSQYLSDVSVSLTLNPLAFHTIREETVNKLGAVNSNVSSK